MFFYYRAGRRLKVCSPWGKLFAGGSGVVIRDSGVFPATHPTTKMCLSLLEEEISKREVFGLVDIGCGSGVLALAGLHLGAARAVALDLSLQAARRSLENARRNQLQGRLLVVCGEAETLRGRHDLVLANLPVPVLRRYLPIIAKLAAPGGCLIASGFQDFFLETMRAEVQSLGLEVERVATREWSYGSLPPSASYTWQALVARVPKRSHCPRAVP